MRVGNGEQMAKGFHSFKMTDMDTALMLLILVSNLKDAKAIMHLLRERESEAEFTR